MSGSGGTKWGTKIGLVLLTVVCGAGAWYARSQEPAVGDRAATQAGATAARYVEEELAEALRRRAPGDDPAKLRNELETTILADTDVVAVRAFGATGALVFSSVANDDTVLDPEITTSVLVDGDRVDGSDGTTLRTYSDAGQLVGEVDQDAAAIRGASTLPWAVAQFGLIGFAIVALGSVPFAGKRARRPKRSDEAAGSAAKQTKKELDETDPEKGRLVARAEKAEQSRRAMEDQLNVLRSQILSGDAGSGARIGELEGHLQDAHNRVVTAEERNAVLLPRVAELEAAVAESAPAHARVKVVEAEIATSRARVEELQNLVKTMEAQAAQTVASVEARAAAAEATATTHATQIEEAHAEARRATTAAREAGDRAVAAERQAEELRALIAADTDDGGSKAGDLVQQLQEELAEAAVAADARERALQDAVARADSTEQLLAAADLRATEAESRADVRVAAPVTPTPASGGDPATEQSIRDLEVALADARADAWAAGHDDTAPSLGTVETHAVPEDEDVASDVQGEVNETDAIRAELLRMGAVVEHAGEAGDVDDLRGRLAKNAARKKGRAVGEERISRSS